VELHDTTGAAFDEVQDSRWGFDSEPPKWVLKGITMDNGGCLMDTDKFFTSKATTLEVHHRTYDPSSASSRHVFLFHALHEHCNKFSYQVLADQLGKGGATVHGLDMQAHGHSDEFDTQFIADYEDLVADAIQWIELTLENRDSHTFQFVSHCEGSAICFLLQSMMQDSTSPMAKYADRFRGHYALAPMISYHPISSAHYGILQCVATVLPCFCASSKMFSTERKRHTRPWMVFQTRKAKTLEVTLDPLAWEQDVPLQTEKTIYDLCTEVRKVIMDISSPVKLVHGSHDEVIPFRGSQWMAKNFAYGRDKKLEDVFWKLPEERHVIMVGNFGQPLFDDIVKWTQDRAMDRTHLVNPMV